MLYRYLAQMCIIALAITLLAHATNASDLVEIRSINPRIHVSSVVAMSKNDGESSQIIRRCYVRRAVAERLSSIQNELETLGLGLDVMNGYRPLSVQKKLWKKCPDTRYVANPANGSRHNRGAAVDLRLISLSTGIPLQMPSKFPAFSSASHRNYNNMPTQEAKKNCKLLELIMGKYGFIPLKTEWWHYDDKNWSNYPVLDLSYKELERIQRHNHTVTSSLVEHASALVGEKKSVHNRSRRKRHTTSGKKLATRTKQSKKRTRNAKRTKSKVTTKSLA